MLQARLDVPERSPEEPRRILSCTTTGSATGPNDVGLDTVTGLSDGRGRFMLLGVPPGDDVLRQANPFLARPLRRVRVTLTSVAHTAPGQTTTTAVGVWLDAGNT